ncbi:MAG: hypothetical protein P4L84_00870 [Isosphaeraceae bacterium]|nr:hypothetical protein [Isosphaeraceae bacterium]
MANPGQGNYSSTAKTVVAPGAIVVTLDAAQQQRAQECLAQTGKITIGFKEVAVTKLGEIVDAEVIVN